MVIQLLKKFPTFCKTGRFITVFTKAHTCPSNVPDESNPLPIHLRSSLMSSSHLQLGLPSVVFLSGFLPKLLYAFLISHKRATYHAHLIPLI